MTMFVIANLGDAAFTLATGTVNTSGTISSGGVTFVNNTGSAPITLALNNNLGLVLFKDIAGNAGEFPITISCAAGIDGGTALQLTAPYAWAWLQWDSGTGSYAVIG